MKSADSHVHSIKLSEEKMCVCTYTVYEYECVCVLQKTQSEAGRAFNRTFSMKSSALQMLHPNKLLPFQSQTCMFLQRHTGGTHCSTATVRLVKKQNILKTHTCRFTLKHHAQIFTDIHITPLEHKKHIHTDLQSFTVNTHNKNYTQTYTYSHSTLTSDWPRACQ